jgi:hypothetical protein
MATVPPRDIDAGGSQRAMSLDRAPVAQARVLAPLREDRVSLTDDHGFRLSDAVRARPGRLGALSVSRGKSVLYGAFVWARGAFNNPNRRFPTRAVRRGGGRPDAGLGDRGGQAHAGTAWRAPLPSRLSECADRGSCPRCRSARLGSRCRPSAARRAARPALKTSRGPCD